MVEVGAVPDYLSYVTLKARYLVPTTAPSKSLAEVIAASVAEQQIGEGPEVTLVDWDIVVENTDEQSSGGGGGGKTTAVPD